MEDENPSEWQSYSAAQQKTIRQGLSILAKVAIRAHLREQAPKPGAAQATRPQEEDSEGIRVTPQGVRKESN